MAHWGAPAQKKKSTKHIAKIRNVQFSFLSLTPKNHSYRTRIFSTHHVVVHQASLRYMTNDEFCRAPSDTTFRSEGPSLFYTAEVYVLDLP